MKERAPFSVCPEGWPLYFPHQIFSILFSIFTSVIYKIENRDGRFSLVVKTTKSSSSLATTEHNNRLETTGAAFPTIYYNKK